MSGFLGLKVVVVIFSSLITGLGLSVGIGAIISSMFVPFNTASLGISKGNALFRQNCAICHAVQSDIIGGFGPNLYNIGDVGSRRVQGMSVEQYILRSILDPQSFKASGVTGHMPIGTVAGVEPELVRSLVGYLTTLGGSVDTDELQKLVINTDVLAPDAVNINVSQLKHGWELFFSTLGCASCHGINGIPGSSLRAPSLEKAGLLSEEYILNSIRNPNDLVSDIWKTVTVKLNNGTEVTGRVLSESVSDIVLLGGGSASHPIMTRIDLDKSTIKLVDEIHESPMPVYNLTIRDEQALVAFLRSLLAEVES